MADVSRIDEALSLYFTAAYSHARCILIAAHNYDNKYFVMYNFIAVFYCIEMKHIFALEKCPTKCKPFKGMISDTG